MAPLIGMIAIVASCCKHVLQVKHSCQYRYKSHPIDFNTPYCPSCVQKWNQTDEQDDAEMEDADAMDTDEDDGEYHEGEMNQNDERSTEDDELAAMLQGLTIQARNAAQPRSTYSETLPTLEELKARNEWFNKRVGRIQCGVFSREGAAEEMSKAIVEYEQRFKARFIDDMY